MSPGASANKDSNPVTKTISLRVEWVTTRIDIPFIELSPSNYVLEFGLEVEIWPEDSECVGSLIEHSSVPQRPAKSST